MTCVTAFDKQRLDRLLRSNIWRRTRATEHLLALEAGLEQARVLASEDVPEDVVTMRSRVHVQDLDSGEERVVTLAFPFEADSAQGKVSVLAPIGTALLGRRAGDTVTWRSASGPRRLRIRSVLYQPEAVGNYGQ
jgi:regulator of nucleoside diphosphate kinase